MPPSRAQALEERVEAPLGADGSGVAVPRQYHGCVVEDQELVDDRGQQVAPAASASLLSRLAATPLLAPIGALCLAGALAESDAKGAFHTKRELACG